MSRKFVRRVLDVVSDFSGFVKSVRDNNTDQLIKSVSAVISYKDLVAINLRENEFKSFWESAIIQELIARLAPEYVLNIKILSFSENEPHFYGKTSKICPYFGLIFSQNQPRTRLVTLATGSEITNCYCDKIDSRCRIIHSHASTVIFNDIVNEDYSRSTLSAGVFLPFILKMEISIFPLDFVMKPSIQIPQSETTFEDFISSLLKKSKLNVTECIIALIPEDNISELESELEKLKDLSKVALWGGEVDTRVCRKLWTLNPYVHTCCKKYDFNVIHLKIPLMKCWSIVLSEPTTKKTPIELRMYYERMLMDFYADIQNDLKEHVFGLIFGCTKDKEKKDVYDHQGIIQSVYLSIFQKPARLLDRPSEPIPLIGMFGKGRVIGLNTLCRSPDEKIIHDKSTSLLIVSYDVPD